jgi:magnesium-transporting ATPase (P-type)
VVPRDNRPLGIIFFYWVINMDWIYIFGIVFFIIFVILYIATMIQIKNNNLCLNELSVYMFKRYKLKLNDKQKRQFMLDSAFINSIILAIPITLVIKIKFNTILIIVISLVLFITLLLISYHLLGLKYKKESEQNGNRRNKKN